MAERECSVSEWALSCTKLLEKRNLSLEQLSGGERERVWIAMTLAQKTPILFLDEPTTYLDIFYQIEILELIKQLNETYALTLVMVLHDINQAIRYSDNIIIMKDGNIAATGNPEDVITASMIKEIYGVDVAVKSEPDTGQYIVSLGIK